MNSAYDRYTMDDEQMKDEMPGERRHCIEHGNRMKGRMDRVDAIGLDIEWRPLINYLKEKGVAIPDLWRDARSTNRLPSELLYDWIARNSMSPREALRIGEHYRLSDYGVVGLAIKTAANFGEALQVVRTYMLPLNPDIRGVRVEVSGADTVDVSIDLHDSLDLPAELRLFNANLVAAASYAMTRNLLLGKIGLIRLRLPASIDDPEPYEAHFGVPVRFGGRGIVFTLPGDCFEQEIPSANQAVFQAAIAISGEVLDTMLSREVCGYRERILQLLESLPDQYPDSSDVARRLGINERTLRRRLTDEGCSYREVLDTVRHKRAKRLLLDKRLRMDDIAEKLGYADTSSFRHAFRRWTGRSPSDFRRDAGVV